MERQYRFMFLYTKEKRWLYNVRIDNNGDIYPMDENGEEDASIDCTKVIKIQYTGLNDKDGKYVYDKDIVVVTNKGIYNGKRVVVWDSALLCYVLVWFDEYNEWNGSQGGTTYLKVSSGIKCYKIGNIFETTELLNP